MLKTATHMTPISTEEQTRWQILVSEILQQARAQGASSAEVAAGTDVGFTVSVRLGEVETVEYHRDKGVDITVYFGHRKGSASTNDTSTEAIKDTVTAACKIARLTQEDVYAGLADAKLMAKNYPDCDLSHPWSITPESAIELAKECETQARAFDPRICNSEGASVTTHQSWHVYGNSHDFIGAYATTHHTINCAVVAQDKEGMQRDGWYSIARDQHELEAIGEIARKAGERTVQRLGAQRLTTRRAPVIFSAEVASGLLSNFLGAISGGNLYRQASFLIDHLNKPVFAKHVQIHERPHVLKALGSAPFDAEGVMTRDRDLIIDGVLQGYLLSSYSARKLGMQTTGNAGGAHNIYMGINDLDFAALLKKMHTGLLITEFLGQGINLVTGDYSRGAAGFWVENGVIQYPVHEITVAGNLRDMFLNLVAVANDIDHRSSIHTGSILLEEMMIAGE
jgi:PmbA protein